MINWPGPTRDGHFWPIGVVMELDNFVVGIIIIGASIFAYGVVKIIDAVNRLPDMQDKKLRQTLFDYADYLDKRKHLQETSDLQMDCWLDATSLSGADEYEALFHETAYKQTEIERLEMEDDFLGRETAKQFMYDEVLRMKKEIDSHPETERRTAEQIAEWEKEYGFKIKDSPDGDRNE